jgi:hypothetical protein
MLCPYGKCGLFTGRCCNITKRCDRLKLAMTQIPSTVRCLRQAAPHLRTVMRYNRIVA